MMTNRTRGARGGSKLNPTLHESPATASLRSATPKKKCSLLFRFVRDQFFLKKERTFFLWCSALQVFGQVAGLQFGLGFAKTIFWGKDFAKPRLIFLGEIRIVFLPAERGLGNECGLAFVILTESVG